MRLRKPRKSQTCWLGIEFPAVMYARVGHLVPADQLVLGIRIHVVLVEIEALAVLRGTEDSVGDDGAKGARSSENRTSLLKRSRRPRAP
jgi:hypothetical protein